MFYRFRLLLFLCLLCTAGMAYSQDADNGVLTANSLKSGNYKDVFTSFFQLAFDSLTGPNKELNFNSNPYAIMARGNPILLNGDNYYKYRHLRALNFNVGLKVDSHYHIKSFSGGLKYSLLNKRDLTINKKYYAALAQSESSKFRTNLNRELGNIQSSPAFTARSAAEQTAYKSETGKLTDPAETAFTFDNLSESTKEILKNYVAGLADDVKSVSPVAFLINNHNAVASQVYKSKKEDIRNLFLAKPLWTVFADGSSYTDQLVFEHVNLGSEFLFGIPQLSNGKRTFTTEIDIKAKLAISNDTFNVGHNLDRQVFSFDPGINFALRNRVDNKSYLEFKLSGTYYHIFSTLRNAEKADSSTINAEIRLRVYDDIWVPIVIKYDPEHQNLFGVLNISANFTGLRNLLGKKEN